MVDTGNEDNEFVGSTVLNTAPTGFNVQHHWSEWREVKWHVVTQCSTRDVRYGMLRTLINQLGTADVDPRFASKLTVPAVQPIVQNPRNVIPVDDALDQGFLGVQRLSELHCNGIYP